MFEPREVPLTRTARFDYLMHEFEFASAPGPLRRVCFFVPESAVPDYMYESPSLSADYEIPEFQPYRIVMDSSLEWVGRIRQIIDASPEPRKPGRRPRRLVPAVSLETSSKDGGAAPVPSGAPAPSTEQYKAVMVEAHRRFFYGVMEECARRLVFTCT